MMEDAKNMDQIDNENDAGDPSAAKVTSRIAFGSCHKSQKSSVPPIWDTILPPIEGDVDNSQQLDAWLWLGDAIYPSHRDPVTNKKYYGPAHPKEIHTSLSDMKHKNATIGYKGFLERLASINADKSRPLVTGVWDDHDFGGNDMGSKMPSKHERREIYENFLGHPPNRKARRPWMIEIDHKQNLHNNEGLYHRVDLEGGKIRVLVLDTRWFREDHCIPSVAQSIPMGNGVACLTRWLTSGLKLHKLAWLWGKDRCENAQVLGEEQWAWLENEILAESIVSPEEATPELFVVLSSIQVWSTNPLMEGWGHFPKEQERLWNLLKKHYERPVKTIPPAPVLFLSGDVHHGEISGQPGYYEVTSSGLTHHCGQHKLYGPVCEPILQTFTGHRDGLLANGQTQNDHGYYIGLNYGVLEILEEDSIRSVRASIRNTTGNSILEVVQPLAGYAPVPSLPPFDQRAHTMDGHLIPYVQTISLWTLISLASILFLRSR